MTSKLPLLDYCRSYFGDTRSSKSPLKCIWLGTKGAIKTSRLRKLESTRPLKIDLPSRLGERGQYPVFYVDSRLVHFSHFCSYVPLYYETSPARNAAVYLLCRLFPSNWRAMFSAAYGGELPNEIALLSIDQYTQTIGSPNWYELCDIAALFVVYMMPASKDQFAATSADFVKGDLMSAFGVQPRARTRMLQYHLGAFATVLRAALSNADLHELLVRMRAMGVCTERQMDKLEKRWCEAKPASLEWVALALSQFKIH